MRRRRLLVLACTLVSGLLLGAGFWLGRQAVYSGFGLDPALYREMQRELPLARARADQLARELDVERTRREVDRRSLEMVRGDIAAQKEQIAGLEEGLAFYRSLMAPGEIAEGLSLRNIELIARAEPRVYAFRIVAQQEAFKHQLLKGELRAEVSGTRHGEDVTYPLADLSADLESEAVPLRFRYFQSIEGEMTLPEGFEPDAVSVVASASTPRKARITERYPWQVKERFTHVGR
jgi:hypothetical protein